MSGEPKVIYTKMIYRPARDTIQAICNHFNIALENKLCSMHNHYFINIEVPHAMFDLTNFLTAKGRSYYWRLLDRHLEDLDNGKSDDFKPQPKLHAHKVHNSDNHQQRYRMPPPPPSPDGHHDKKCRK